MSTNPTNPFGGGVTHGTPGPPFKQRPALQYGGKVGINLISLMQFLSGNSRLVGDPLQIEYATGSGVVISRDTSGTEEPGANLTIRAALKHFGIDGYDPSTDSPPIEIRATYVPWGVGGTELTSTPAPGPVQASSHIAKNVNAADYLSAYLAAFADGVDLQPKVDFLVKAHGMTPEVATARLAEAGYSA